MSLETGSQLREQRRAGGAAIPTALVDRPRLLSRLRSDPDRTVLVCAPSGYGKSTLIEQWAEADSRRFCRVLLGAHHNDPVVLTSDIVGAITGEAVVDAAEINALGAPGVETGRIAPPILREVLQREKDPSVLVLDELERVDSAASLAIVGGLAAGMPAGTRLVLLSRTEPQMRLPRLRAGRHLNELGRDDLLMTKSESKRLLDGLDLTLGSDELDAIIRRTEGWPAALYLAGLAIGGSPDPGREIAKFDGDDRIVIDYIREEFLESVTQRQMAFLRRASILERLSGPTCDAVLKRKGSARILSDLARANMLLIPLDRRDEWFRFHPLLREMLRADLRRVEPKAEQDLHLRASEWWEGRGEWELAISQAVESGSVARVGELLWTITPKYMTRGLNASIVSWLGVIGEEAVASDAAASLTAAWSELTLGNGPKAEHWNNCAKEKLRDVRGARAQSLETGVWLADAVLFRDGVGPMRAACANARARLPEDDPWQTVCSMLDGVGLHLTGDSAAARRVLRDGVRRGAVAAPNLQAVCMSQLALMAIDEGDWDLAEHEISHARAQIERCGLSDYPMVAIAFAVSAWTRAKHGRVDVATKDLQQGTRLLAQLDRYIPWYEAEALLALGRASARLGDPAGARELVKRASREIESIDDAPVLESWLAETERSLGRGVLDDDPLTRAETRVLQLLATHLSNPQIAAELNVSPNTVKTHVRSIYRKLGATTRQAAVERARAGDLLDR